MSTLCIAGIVSIAILFIWIFLLTMIVIAHETDLIDIVRFLKGL